MIIYAGGVFDLIHPGHIMFLEGCANHGRLVVALNTDEFSRRYKRQPVQSLAERMTVVGALACVSEVMVNWGDEDSTPSILASRASKIAHGGDWAHEGLYKQMGFDQEWLDERGIEMLYLPVAQGQSTSNLLTRIRVRNG